VLLSRRNLESVLSNEAIRQYLPGASLIQRQTDNAPTSGIGTSDRTHVV